MKPVRGWGAIACVCGCASSEHTVDGRACSRHFLTCRAFRDAEPRARAWCALERQRRVEGARPMKLTSEETAAIVTRLRREQLAPFVPGIAGDVVHEIPREDLVAAHDAGVLLLDRECTARLLAEAEGRPAGSFIPRGPGR
jgi:hypothetical protein